MAETFKITSIEFQAKRKDRFSVFMDGEFAFGLHQNVLIKCGIAKGDELTQAQIDSIINLEENHAAKEKAMRLLAVRARSKKELRDRLKQTRFSSDTIDQILIELERIGLLNDAEFAKMFARSKMITKPMGKFLLVQEMKQKGLSEQNINEALDQAYLEKSESQIAFELASKRKQRYVDLEELKAKKRVSDFLVRRGFSWDIVKSILDQWQEL